MDTSISKSSFELRLKITGPLSEKDNNSFKNLIQDILEETQDQIVLDLTDVPSISSSGIGKILVLYHQLTKQNRDLSIKGINENLFSLFVSLDIDKVIPIHKN